VTSAIVGARNAEQARRNVRGAELALPTDVIEELARSTDALKTRLGSNADMWQSESRLR
jgi:myo-inositol catabolism protein IolS